MAATISNAAFLADFPEFNGATAALVTAKIAQAARMTNEDMYQSTDLVNDAIKLKAAHLLILSPYGAKMRSASPDQATVWAGELRKLQRAATLGARVF